MSQALSAPPTRYCFGLATPDDNAALCGMLRGFPMGRAVRVTFERDPDYFAAATAQGDWVQVVTCRDRDKGRIVGLGTRAGARGFLNGSEAALGYLSDLRLEPSLRGGTLVGRGYRYLRSLHADGRARLYFTVIVADNVPALRVLAGGRAGLPAYRDMGLLLTPALHLGRPLPDLAEGGEIVGGSRELLPRIVACLNSHNRSRQLAPAHRLEDFLPGGRWKGVRPEDFLVALRGGRVVGTLARWDQSGFKKVRVHGYSPLVRTLRPVLNALSPFLGAPALPFPGETLPHFFAAFPASLGDDLTVFRALMRRMYNDSRGRGYSHFICGLHERDPLAAALKDYRAAPFAGRLFAAHFEDGRALYEGLDGRVPYVEAGAL